MLRIFFLIEKVTRTTYTAVKSKKNSKTELNIQFNRFYSVFEKFICVHIFKLHQLLDCKNIMKITSRSF